MAAIDGLSSGLDTSSIIKQLMQLEKQPQVRLQSRQSATESAILSLRTLNSKFLAISTATARLGAALPGTVAPATPATTDWQLTAASTSDATRATVSAMSGAPAGTMSFNVRQLAATASHLSAGEYGSLDDSFSVVPGTTTAHTSLTLTKHDGSTVTIGTGDGTLGSTVSAINAANAGVRASTIQVSTGVHRMQLTATASGHAGNFTLTDPDGGNELKSGGALGKDAELWLSGVAITSPTNTFANVLEGVTLTVTKTDTEKLGADGLPFDPPQFVAAPVTVEVKKDTDGIAAKISALVDAANAARSEARSLTAVDPTTKAKGRLYGDSGVRALVDRVRAAIVDGDAEVGLAGVSVARDGTVSFDKAKFLERLTKEPTKVEAALGKDGMAGRLHRLADEVSRGEAATAGPGLITSGIKSRESQIATLKDGIASWDVRLAAKEKMLQRQYTALETALGKAKSQGSWLAGQLANLPQAGS